MRNSTLSRLCGGRSDLKFHYFQYIFKNQYNAGAFVVSEYKAVNAIESTIFELTGETTNLLCH